MRAGAVVGLNVAVLLAGCASQQNRRPTGTHPATVPATASTSAGPASTPLARRLWISDLERESAPRRHASPSTALLARRSKTNEGSRRLAPDFELSTRCSGNACVDGLREPGAGLPLVSAALTADDREILAPQGSWLERRLWLASATDRFVSVYVAESSFSGGAAHANNSLSCRTFNRKTGRQLTLADVLPDASRLTARVQALIDDPDRAVEVLGDSLDSGGVDASGSQLTARGFIVKPVPGRKTTDGILLELCAEGPYALAGSVVEIALDRIPATYLRRRQ